MEFRVLGPVGVFHDGRCAWLGGRRERTLLATLLLAAGRVVPINRLIDVVWGDAPPATARRQVHSAVSVLRRVLGDRLTTVDPGYLVTVEPGELDLEAFTAEAGAARAMAAEGHSAAAADRLRAALRRWRGPALGGVTGLAAEAARLEEQRLAVLAERLDLDLLAGRHADLVGELSALVAEYPLAERFRAQLMLALYRCGRQAEALQVFREVRRVLAEDLGLEPRGELRRLERAVLVADPALDLPEWAYRDAQHARSERRTRSTETPDTPGGGCRPCMLPADLADFTGRTECLATLTAALTAALREAPTGSGRVVAVAAVTGPAGVGKTALAVTAAHRLRTVFDDGQLYVDLHGPGAAAVEPAEVLGRFLRALGVAAPAIPEGLDERAELYRQRLAGRRVLVVLDNAGHETQVAALLPGSPTCGVLVTSRARLGGLAGAWLVDLEPFEPAESLRLLSRVIGAARVAAEPVAAAELAALCGQLPLAVRIAAARLAARPHWPVSELAARLTDESRRLDELVHGGLAVRASIDVSYQSLHPRARWLLRRLGLLALPEFAGWAAAVLLGTAPTEADDLMQQLVDARLLRVVTARRYRFHDLVRIYARERAEAEDSAAARAARNPGHSTSARRAAVGTAPPRGPEGRPSRRVGHAP